MPALCKHSPPFNLHNHLWELFWFGSPWKQTLEKECRLSIREGILGNANREAGKGSRERKAASLSDVSKAVTLETIGDGSCWELWEPGQACIQDTSNEGPGTWGMDTSTSGCYWLVATLGQQSINLGGGAPIFQHATPIFSVRTKITSSLSEKETRETA